MCLPPSLPSPLAPRGGGECGGDANSSWQSGADSLAGTPWVQQMARDSHGWRRICSMCLPPS
eukprot:CAMPEP_0180145568 /NCGR_PEP_ID=MMETSP0986-20121125/17779_1 /TAXON_ID=697907 /ORGANISM="non described non described, Strain CCMP2293" /LENGTH=61 /DNA_ID=CAMNT_0022090033 /DNA_START=98 /DNA_END=280 /DNA_ORIENTATION=+